MVGRSIDVDIIQNDIRYVAHRVDQEMQVRRKTVIRMGIFYARLFAAVDTGFMRDHIDEVPEGYASHAHYSKYQEFGTWKMTPRPFMRPSVRKVRAEINKAFAGFSVAIVRH